MEKSLFTLAKELEKKIPFMRENGYAVLSEVLLESVETIAERALEFCELNFKHQKANALALYKLCKYVESNELWVQTKEAEKQAEMYHVSLSTLKANRRNISKREWENILIAQVQQAPIIAEILVSNVKKLSKYEY